MPKKPQPKKLHSWRIFRIRGTPAAEIGTVQAPDAETAIKVAIKEFNIKNPEQQKRLMAQRRD
jgi:1,2-phenylacetyl-CoA epoxidase PaaB subunit